MELFQVLHKNIPQKKKIRTLLYVQQQQDISKFILQTIKNVKKEIKDVHIINLFFIEFYDMIYYYIIFDKVKVVKRIVRILEILALPEKEIGEKRRKETFKKIKRIKL